MSKVNCDECVHRNNEATCSSCVEGGEYTLFQREEGDFARLRAEVERLKVPGSCGRVARRAGRNNAMDHEWVIEDRKRLKGDVIKLRKEIGDLRRKLGNRADLRVRAQREAYEDAARIVEQIDAPRGSVSGPVELCAKLIRARMKEVCG